jgi:hypothetical protein
MPKLPWFRFFPSAWLSDAALSIVSEAARGVASDLMCVAFDMPERAVYKTNGKPWTIKQMAHSARGMGKRRVRCVKELITAGVLKRRESGEFYWSRIVRDDLERQMEREKKQKQRQAKQVPSGTTLEQSKVHFPGQNGTTFH